MSMNAYVEITGSIPLVKENSSDCVTLVNFPEKAFPNQYRNILRHVSTATHNQEFLLLTQLLAEDKKASR